ncbi:MAG: 4'-phosphopantetheinyl transferase superfamily protein [Runella slithyformis]|nr:MAG: 4'-phosphopantetheinyl transferase superfamily protein [Runella slithyformis]
MNHLLILKPQTINSICMPIVRRWRVFDDCEIALWQITETTDELQQNLIASPDEWAEYATIAHPQKQREWLAGRQTVQALITSNALTYSGLVKDEFGKPHLRAANAQISVTHTSEYVAVATHPTLPVGIDVERAAEKLRRVAPKFLSEKETQHASDNLARLATYWCSKEALYKLHGVRKIRFKEDIPIDDFDDAAIFLTGHLLYAAGPQTHRLHRFWIDDFCGVLAV